MSHCSKPWTCCDRREQGDRGSTGCKRRSHAGPPVDPTYSKQVHEMQSAFETKNRALDEQIAAISDENWVLEANKVKKDQLQVISEHLRKEREIVGRFKETKLDKYMSDEAPSRTPSAPRSSSSSASTKCSTTTTSGKSRTRRRIMPAASG